MLHKFIRLLARLSRSSRAATPKRLRHFPGIETLEDRTVPSASISGFVYTDNNDNGILDAGEIDGGAIGRAIVNNNQLPRGPRVFPK